MKFRIGILTLSDKGAAGLRVDSSTEAIEAEISRSGLGEIIEKELLPDRQELITDKLIKWSDSGNLDLIITCGGTGLAPSDLTPEATLSVIDRRAPGFEEAMRAASLRITPHAMISRAVCGARKSTFIVNLPGSPKAAVENLQTIMPALPHALAKLAGDDSDCARHD